MPWRRRSRLHGLPRSYSFNFQADRTYHQGRNRSGSRLYIADIETLDEPVLYLEDVDHHSVGQEIALWVTHHRMNFDNDFPLAIGRDLDGLNIGIDHRPLTLPIAAHLIASVDVATFHSICPNDVGVHGRENAFAVPAIEEGIDSSQEFHVIRHSVLPFMAKCSFRDRDVDTEPDHSNTRPGALSLDEFGIPGKPLCD